MPPLWARSPAPSSAAGWGCGPYRGGPAAPGRTGKERPPVAQLGPCPPAAAGTEGAPPAPPGQSVPPLLPAPVPGAAARCGRLRSPPAPGGCWPRRRSPALAAPQRIPPLPRCCRAAPAGSSPAASGGASAVLREPGRPLCPAGGPWRPRLEAQPGPSGCGRAAGRTRAPAGGSRLGRSGVEPGKGRGAGALLYRRLAAFAALSSARWSFSAQALR